MANSMIKARVTSIQEILDSNGYHDCEELNQVTDILTDMLHFCESRHLDFEDSYRAAQVHFWEERDND